MKKPSHVPNGVTYNWAVTGFTVFLLIKQCESNANGSSSTIPLNFKGYDHETLDGKCKFIIHLYPKNFNVGFYYNYFIEGL